MACNGYASSAVYSQINHVRGLSEKFGAEPCTTRVCIEQAEPAGPKQGVARDFISAATASDTAPVNTPGCQCSYNGPLCEPGTASSGPFSCVTSSLKKEHGYHVVISARFE